MATMTNDQPPARGAMPKPAGLVRSAMGQAPSGMAADMRQPAAAGQAPQGKGAPPQVQDAYRRTVTAGMKVLYDDATHGQIMARLQAEADEPEKALADVGITVMAGLMEKSGGKIPTSVLIPAGIAVMTLASELAEAGGLFETTPESVQAASQSFIEAMVGRYGSPQDKAQFAARQQAGGQPQGAAAPAPGAQAAPQGIEQEMGA